MPQTKVPYFSIERDMEIVKNGGLFCIACLVGKPPKEASPDPRYCQSCYDFLLEEAALLTGTTRPKWIPRRQESGKNIISGAGDGYAIMLPSEDTEIHRYHNSTDSRRRGPKQKPLPEERIRGLSSAGLGVKAIANELKGEGVLISAETISRLLRGERQQSDIEPARG